MKQEFKEAIFKYIDNHKVYYLPEQENDFFKTVEFFNSGILCFDRPDGFCKKDNSVLIIEHFEFDSSNNTKKGSQNRQEEARISRREHESTDISFIRDQINCNYSIENYIKNAKKFFDSHYNNIQEYKKNLKKEKIITDTTEVKTLFCIEDVTALGNYDINERTPVILLYCDEFIEYVKDCLELDYILCFSSFGQETYTWFASIKNILEYKEKALKKENIKLAELQPQVISTRVKVK